MDVTDDDAPWVKLALFMGYWQHRIAAYLDVATIRYFSTYFRREMRTSMG